MPVNIGLESGRLNKHLLCLQGTYNLVQEAKVNSYNTVWCYNEGISKVLGRHSRDLYFLRRGLGNSSPRRWHLIWKVHHGEAGGKGIHVQETSYSNAWRCLESSGICFGKGKHLHVVEVQCFRWAEVEGELGELWGPRDLGTMDIFK